MTSPIRVIIRFPLSPTISIVPNQGAASQAPRALELCPCVTQDDIVQPRHELLWYLQFKLSKQRENKRQSTTIPLAQPSARLQWLPKYALVMMSLHLGHLHWSANGGCAPSLHPRPQRNRLHNTTRPCWDSQNIAHMGTLTVKPHVRVIGSVNRNL